MDALIADIQLPSANRAAYRSRYSGQPASPEIPSATASQPGPCRSIWRWMSSTRVRSGLSATNVTSTSLALLGSTTVVEAAHHPLEQERRGVLDQLPQV